MGTVDITDMDKDEGTVFNDGAEQAEEASQGGKPAKEFTIEESFDRLDHILDRMNDEKTGLEETFRLYEEGLKLVNSINNSIDRVEKRIRILEEGVSPEA